MSPFLRSAGDDPVQPHPEAPIRVSINGESVEALRGQTVAAALLAGGQDSWRTTRLAGRPRGVFCGIGACFDCLVVVNGIPDVRACQRTLADGDAITTQLGAAFPTKPHPSSGGSYDEAARIVVVGAGPAGIAAALVAADAGVDVLLVDAAPAVGGQFHRQLPAEFHAERPEQVQQAGVGSPSCATGSISTSASRTWPRPLCGRSSRSVVQRIG